MSFIQLDEKLSAETSTEYVKLIDKEIHSRGAWLKNLSYAAVSGEESVTDFKVKIGNHFDKEGVIFTNGFSFSQDFNKDEVKLKRGARVQVYAKSTDGTAISPQAFVLIIDEVEI